MSKKVAIKGYAASFHDVAARQLIDPACQIIPCDTFEQVVALVQDGTADYGVMATENSNHGPIPESQVPLQASGLRVLGELKMRIEQCLLVLPGTQLSDIREVYSDPIALSQCSVFLKTYVPQAVWRDHADTAESAADVKRWGDKTKASVASRAAAEQHGLEVLVPGIETDTDNFTCFVSFSR